MFREEIILSHTRGKKVLDCGGVDHWAFDEKKSRGEWLHALVAEQAQSCLGIDILEENITAINRAGRYRFERHNVESLTFEEEFDIVLAGEIVEHLYNMGLFLDSAWRALRPDGLLIITTPNAYAMSFWAYSLVARVERCHPEHTCYYSPQTLSYIVTRHGFAIEKLHLLPRQARWKFLEWARGLFDWICPIISEQIVLIARKQPTQSKYEDKW